MTMIAMSNYMRIKSKRTVGRKDGGRPRFVDVYYVPITFEKYSQVPNTACTDAVPWPPDKLPNPSERLGGEHMPRWPSITRTIRRAESGSSLSPSQHKGDDLMVQRSRLSKGRSWTVRTVDRTGPDTKGPGLVGKFKIHDVVIITVITQLLNQSLSAPRPVTFNSFTLLCIQYDISIQLYPVGAEDRLVTDLGAEDNHVIVSV
ncbi:hypothetical protein JOM56_007648 [Amanita muscaria]